MSVVGVEGIAFFSVCSFCCIAKQVMSLKQLRLVCCLDSLETNVKPLCVLHIILLLPVSPTSNFTRYNTGVMEV